MDPHTDNVALIALSLTPGFSWRNVRAQIEKHGSPSSALQAEFSDRLLDDEYEQAISRARSFVRSCNANGVQVSSLWSQRYPERLRGVHDAPPVLFWQGTLSSRDEDAVAIVGTRMPDPAGARFAHDLATKLSLNNIPVVSGIARGIDGIALRASLAVHGRVVGVIGTGHDIAYPPEHADLQGRIAEHLLISQFRPGSTISKRNFPMRNAVMSGFSSTTVIVQAGETSGTRIQAKAAVKHGRPLVITSSVFQSAEWARTLVEDEHDVVVVRTADEALEAVADIHARRTLFVDSQAADAYLVG